MLGIVLVFGLGLPEGGRRARLLSYRRGFRKAYASRDLSERIQHWFETKANPTQVPL